MSFSKLYGSARSQACIWRGVRFARMTFHSVVVKSSRVGFIHDECTAKFARRKIRKGFAGNLPVCFAIVLLRKLECSEMWFSRKLRRLWKALHVAKLMVAEAPAAQTKAAKQRKRRKVAHKPVRKETKPYTAQSFWDKFEQDITNAKSYIVFVCPFIYPRRWNNLLPQFKRILNNGVELVFHTRPKAELRKSAESEDRKIFIDQVFEWFRRDGVTTIEESGIHQKIVLIDGRILWCGSLNVLSHFETKEIMLRITDPHLIRCIVEQHNIEVPSFRREAS